MGRGQPSTGWTKRRVPRARCTCGEKKRMEEVIGEVRGEESEQWVSRQSGREITNVRHSRDRLIVRETGNMSLKMCRWRGNRGAPRSD